MEVASTIAVDVRLKCWLCARDGIIIDYDSICYLSRAENLRDDEDALGLDSRYETRLSKVSGG